MNKVEFGNRFGYAEMYEWHELLPSNIVPFGKLVQFNKEVPYTIQLARNTENIIGITTINSVIDSDNPQSWPYMCLFNEYGDFYLKKDVIAKGSKVYDELEELSYIKTEKQEVLSPVINDAYQKETDYVPRTQRKEWIRVTLLGKAIVEDNGECVDGGYCTLYTGDDQSKFGTVVPAKEDDKFKLYVLNRVSDKTILVFMK